MHILIITSSYPAVYGESFEGACIEAFAEALVQHGCRVDILTQCTGAPLYQDAPGITVHRFPWRGVARPLAGLSLWRDPGQILSYFRSGSRTLRQLVSPRAIDVTLCAWTLPSGLFGWYLKRRCGIPYLTWSLGSDIWRYAHHSVPRRLLKLILDNAWKNYADGYDLIEQIDTISSAGASFLSTTRILPPASPNPVVLTQGKTHFLFVGRYHPNKGPDLLLEAICHLHEQIRNHTCFHFFGVGEMQAALESKVRANALEHCTTIKGPITAPMLSAYLEAVDYLIIPSRIDSLPVILSDALQKQCPVIVTDVGDTGRVVSEHGAGCVVPPEDPLALAKAIEQTLVQPASYQRGIETLHRLFNVRDNAMRLLDDIQALKPQTSGLQVVAS
jgi:glycosyltransferase involved in cell wall biosynthesis